jgi:hypothetical protein
MNARYQFSFIDFSKLLSLHDLMLSNLPVSYLLDIFNSLSLKELEYIYLGAYFSRYGYGSEQEKIEEVQEKVLSLGESKLKKCVLKMPFYANIDKLPTKLSSLEYLRIDRCENILIVNQLLDRMPNLISFYVSILESIQTNDNKAQYMKQNNRNTCLTNLTLRIPYIKSRDELMLLFSKHCSNVKKLIIYLDSVTQERSSDYTRPDVRFINLHEWITTIVKPLMPQLTNFHLRQHVLSQNYDFPNRRCNSPPYIEEIPCSLEHGSYRVHIASHLTPLWKNSP